MLDRKSQNMNDVKKLKFVQDSPILDLTNSSLDILIFNQKEI